MGSSKIKQVFVYLFVLKTEKRKKLGESLRVSSKFVICFVGNRESWNWNCIMVGSKCAVIPVFVLCTQPKKKFNSIIKK